MEFHEIVQTTSALSGLICLIIGLHAAKKMLRALIR